MACVMVQMRATIAMTMQGMMRCDAKAGGRVLRGKSDEACEVSYKDRGGKYQGQRGVTLPRA